MVNHHPNPPCVMICFTFSMPSNAWIHDFAHIPWEDTPNFPRPPTKKEIPFINCWPKRLGYLPRVCGWDLRSKASPPPPKKKKTTHHMSQSSCRFFLGSGSFKHFLLFTPIWGRFPIWRAYFIRWVETTKQFFGFCEKSHQRNPMSS